MSKIEWVTNIDGSRGDTWNPITGCTKVSPGCTNCYAETMAHRLKAMGLPQYQDVIGDNSKWNGTIRFVPSALDKPLKRKKPQTYFVNSMSDLFHADVELDWLDAIWDVMSRCQQHTFQILTKRASLMHHRMAHYDVLPNVWLGVSVEDQKRADERIPLLLQTPAAVRFLSCEPLLGPVDLHLNGTAPADWTSGHLSDLIHWVIVGGESGPKARPMHPDWVREICEQCQAANVPFFFKQWGEWIPINPDCGDSTVIYNTNKPERGVGDGSGRRLPAAGYPMRKVGKKAAGNLLDGTTWQQYPARTV